MIFFKSDLRMMGLDRMCHFWCLGRLRVKNSLFRDIENSKNAISLETGSTSGIDSRPSPGPVKRMKF